MYTYIHMCIYIYIYAYMHAYRHNELCMHIAASPSPVPMEPNPSRNQFFGEQVLTGREEARSWAKFWPRAPKQTPRYYDPSDRDS